MIKDFLSYYRPRYLRSLTYMLQASEYHIRDYLSWFYATNDFGTVERRKQLEKTPKAVIILVLFYFLLFFFIWFGIFLFQALAVPYNWFFTVIFLIALPYLLAYGIIAPLLVVQVIGQKPIEYFLIRRAKTILQNHKGVKIAVAGSFGKTSMREILKTVLSEGKKVATPPHSYNTPLGISEFTRSLRGDEEVLVVEFGEYYPGDVWRLCRLVDPDIGIITGVNEAHLEKFKEIERSAKTIFELADALGDRPLYVNGESEVAKKHATPEHVLYSRQGIGTWLVRDAKTDLDGTSFILVNSTATINAQSQLLGFHQVGALATAAHIALRLGLTISQIEAGIRKTKPFEHRMEKTIDQNGVITLDDSYNGNPDGVAAVIQFLASLKGCRRFYITPGLVEMGPKTEAVHKEVGRRLAEAGIEKVILIKDSVTPYIERGLKEASYRGEILWFNDAIAAFAALPFLTARGDVVLLQNDWPDQYR